MKNKNRASIQKPKLSREAATKAGLTYMIHKATGTKRTKKGPEPERLKITGVRNWEEAVGIAMQKKKPSGGWAKR
jgi:hypothetical protein